MTELCLCARIVTSFSTSIHLCGHMLIWRADGTIALDGDDAESLRLADEERTETSRAAAIDVDETLI